MPNTEDDDVKLFTTAQVAAFLEVTPETIRNWIDDGTLPAIKLNNLWRVTKRDLRDFISRRHNV